jgi:serine O-acetyltransferase
MKLLDDLDMYSFRLGLPYWCAIFMPLIYITTWPVVCYRFQHWVFYHVKIPLIRQILMIIGYLIKVFVIITTGITISHRTTIGKGLFIAHIGSIVIGHSTIIGDYCSLHQCVTFGGAGTGGNNGSPQIGDNAYIGVGAVLMGKIKIGNNVAIGANAVVTKNFPDNVSIGGVPARIISEKGSHGLIHYRGQRINNV